MMTEPTNLHKRVLVGIFSRLLVLCALVAVCYGLYLVSEAAIDPQLQVKNAELESELKRVRQEILSLKQESAELKGEVERLKGDPDEIAYHARNGLGMLRPGEVIYRFDDRAQSDTEGGR